MTCKEEFVHPLLPRYALRDPKCLPHIGSEQAAGIDLRSGREDVYINSGREYIFNTGFACEIPKGWVGLVLPRSGMGFKYKLRLLNTCGVIDSDYRDYIKVGCTFEADFWLEDYERICQLVVVPHYQAKKLLSHEVTLEELSQTERGTNGFGSSGRK